MSLKKRLTLKGGALVLALSLVVLAFQFSAPAPARACTWMWGVAFHYYYSTGGYCYEGCEPSYCWGDTSGEAQVSQGECYYCG